jgi:hypothetical protein
MNKGPSVVMNVGVIIDSGRHKRRLDVNLSTPKVLESVSEGTGSVMDWALGALRAAGVRSVAYFGGYHVEKVLDRYPDLTIRYCALWSYTNT